MFCNYSSCPDYWVHMAIYSEKKIQIFMASDCYILQSYQLKETILFKGGGLEKLGYHYKDGDYKIRTFSDIGGRGVNKHPKNSDFIYGGSLNYSFFPLQT